LIASKDFTTQEMMSNANSARLVRGKWWFFGKKQHFVALSTNES
jgi:glucose-6-phosphate isomerase